MIIRANEGRIIYLFEEFQNIKEKTDPSELSLFEKVMKFEERLARSGKRVKVTSQKDQSMILQE